MPESPLSIVETRETLFFSHEAGSLRQWILVTVANSLGEALPAQLTIAAGGQEVVTELQLRPGVHEYRCYAPTLWPDHAPEAAAPVRLQAGGHEASAAAAVGHHRPWTLYVLTDDCTDYAWVYGDEQTLRADDAELTHAELMLTESTRDNPPENRNHYNMAVGRQVEFYLERYPQNAEKLFNAMRAGLIGFNPFFNMCLSGVVSLEELFRQFYPSREIALDEGLELCYANHQETPAITWSYATVMAECGVRYLVKGNLPYECPWYKRYQEPPVFWWEGPDGSRILYRRRNEDYVEGNFLLRDLRQVNTAIHARLIPGYEALGERYPFSAMGLVGVYGDLSADTRNQGARRVSLIGAYNAQGWEYPKLVNASHAQFWADIEAQMAARQVHLPIFRGDYGVGWEAWPASLAVYLAGWRRAQEKVAAADKLCAVLSQLDPWWFEAAADELRDAWLNLVYLADHAWNGANGANIELNYLLRRQWQLSANTLADNLLESGLETLGRKVQTGERPRILVYNCLGWERSGLVHVAGVEPGAVLRDAETGQLAPTQAVERDGQRSVCFLAQDVPSIGYRTYTIEAADPGPVGKPACRAEGTCLEGPFYRLEVSPVTGGLTSLFDKVRGKELVNGRAPYHLNQCLYLSEDVEHTPQMARIEPGAAGRLFAQLCVSAQLKNTTLHTTYTVYADLDRVDIRNELEKTATSEKQELDFAFPFQVPDCQVRYEAPGAIIDPAKDMLPGAGLATYAVRHFVDLFNNEYGVTLSQADSGIFELGHRTTLEDPEAPELNGTVLAMALDNYLDWNEACRNQAGETRFTFRYSIRGHGAGFDPVAAVRFGWEDNNELLATVLAAEQDGDLPAAHSFCRVDAPNAVLFTLKVAEEEDEGLIARLWECAGQGGSVPLVCGIEGLSSACATDGLERDREALPVQDDRVTVPLRARGIATVRLMLG
ncbi:MAG: glycoside hydrolase family 38 C-terminal domain-containing protein [Anaerolineae bacterium]